MKNIKFSIIVPVYNVERYLVECIESILSQSYSDFELILIDDGSSDESPKICDKYAILDGRIKVIHKKNGGVTSARKEGTKIASGEYIVCIDADDYIGKNYLKEFFEVIINFKPDIVCCGSTFKCGNRELKCHLNLKKGYFSKQEIEKNIYCFLIEDEHSNYFPPSVWGKAIKKDIFKREQLSINDKIHIGEDKVCIIGCVYNSGSLYITEGVSYYYRYNDKGATKSRAVYSWEEQLLIRDHLLNRLKDSYFNFKDQINRNATHGLFTAAVSNFNKNNSYKNISKEVMNKLQQKEYKEIIDNSYFKFLSKGNLVKISLKYKLIFLIYIFNKIKN